LTPSHPFPLPSPSSRAPRLPAKSLRRKRALAWSPANPPPSACWQEWFW
jgi:hypothetical protein